MTKFEVFLSKIANNFLLSLDEKTRERIKSSLRELETDPYRNRSGADLKKLHSTHKPDLYRLRVGDFRAMYFISGNKVKVTEIIRRGKGYEWLD